MEQYRYQAVDTGGRVVHGEMEVDHADAVGATLRAQGLLLLRMERHAVDRSITSRPRSVARLSRALAGLLESGLPLPRALSSVARTARPDEAAMLLDVRRRLEKGSTFAHALEPHAAFFPELFLGVVRAGERSGNLAASLAQLARHTETELEIRQKLVSAAVYPALLFVTGGASVALLLLWVLPRFSELPAEAGATLPWSTALLLRFSDWLTTLLPLAPPLAMLVLGAAGWMTATEHGRRRLFGLLLRLPYVGRLRSESLGARFARLLSVLLRGGAPMLEALTITARSFRDPVANSAILDVRDRVREGENLNQALSRTGVIPQVVLELGRFGEEAGRLPEFLERAAEILEANEQEMLRRVSVLAEPVLIVFFGGVVGFVAFSLMQAIYGLNSGLGG